MLTKDDVTNNVSDNDKDIAKDIAIDNLRASINDLEDIRKTLTKPGETLPEFAFMFGTYYNDLYDQLNDVLKYLEKK